MKKISLSVPDMTCGHCVTTVQAALAGVPGVSEADVSLEEKRATVRAEDELVESTLVEAVEQAGYSASRR